MISLHRFLLLWVLASMALVGHADSEKPIPSELRAAAVTVLEEGLNSDEFWPSMHAAEALTLAGHEEAVLTRLEPLLSRETDDQKRCGLAREMVRAGDLAKRSVLLGILTGEDSHGHVHAAESLYKVGWEGNSTPFRKALEESSDILLRLMAAAALARHGRGDDRASGFAFLRKTIQDHPDPDTFRLAAWVLGRVGNKDDKALLRARIPDAESDLAKAFLHHSLALLGDAAGQSALLSNLESNDPAIRTYAAVFAGECGLIEAIPLLTSQLQDEALDSRIRAAQAIIVLSQDSTLTQ